MLAGLVAIPPVLENLGRERFGVLSLAWAVLIYFSIFDLGMNRAIVKFTAELLGRGRAEEAPKVFWSALTIQAGLVLVGMAVFLPAVPLLTEKLLTISPAILEETQRAFTILVFFFPALLLTLALRSVLEAAQRFDIINLIKVPATTGNFLIPLLGIALGMKLPGIFGLMLAFRVIVVAAYVFSANRVFPELRKRPEVSRKVMRSLITYGGWLTVSNMIGPLAFYLESFFIGSMLSVQILAYYSAPFEIVSQFVIIPGAVAGALFPMISSVAVQSGQSLERLFTSSVKYILLLMTPLCLVCLVFAGDILTIWLGADFAVQGRTVLILLALVFFINSFAYIPLTVILALGRPELKAKLDLVLLPAFALLLWLVLPLAGVVGAAWVKMAIFLADAVVLYCFAFRVSKIRVREFFSRELARAVWVSLGCAGLILLIPHLLSGLVPRLIGVGLVLVLFAVLFFGLAMDREERAFVLKTVGLAGRGE